MYRHAALPFFIFTEPWVTPKEELRVRQFIAQAYYESQNASDERRAAAYHVVCSKNGLTTVVLSLN